MDNMTKKNNSNPTTESNRFYEFINSRKSSILSTFSMSTKPPVVSIAAARSIDLVHASRSVDQNEFIFKSNGNYTVNSIGASEIGEINDPKNHGMNISIFNPSRTITSSSPKITRGSSSKVYNLLGMLQECYTIYSSLLFSPSHPPFSSHL